MKKNIIITSGPTNERLDAVMKITNMSTGTLGAKIAEDFIINEEDEIERVYYLSTKLSKKPNVSSPKLECITIESTDDLINELRTLLMNNRIDSVIHSAAVGDYKGEYSITASMLANEIAKKIYNLNIPREVLAEKILEIIRHPEITVSDEHKISSYEQDLMFKLTLTPKVIGEIKKISPATDLIGFKLLDGVSKEKLIEVATKLREKNKAKYIIANDLSKIGNGKHKAYFVGENGVEYICETKDDIAKTLRKVIF